MPSNTLTVTDNRTDRTYTFPIEDGTVRAMDFRRIKTSEDDFGLMLYDPAFMNTASCRSDITYIDGDRGILEYRGYPIEQLAEHCTFLEVAYLILFGELPKAQRTRPLGLRDHPPHHAARDDEEVHGGFPARCPPHVDADQHRGGSGFGLSRGHMRCTIPPTGCCRSSG